MNNTSIDSYLGEYESYLQDLILNTNIPSDNLKKAIFYALFPGGKRIRPLLVYLCGALFNVNKDCLNIIAASIELIHCYSLIHDDLPAMDNDDFRRGKPSLHKAFDEATAILAGDGLQTLAFEILLKNLPQYLSLKQSIDISLELARASGSTGMLSGQDFDLNMLGKESLQENELQSIHLLKTGQLINATANMVLIAANATLDERKALQDYTFYLGLVFQIQDDYLDHYGKDALGKGRASDSANNKKTYTSFYNQEELTKLIQSHFNAAKNALRLFGEKSEPLLALTNDLEQRSVS